MKFEWAQEKARANLKKHGVEFEEAATVFFDPNGLNLPDPKHSSKKEVRTIRLGLSIYTRVLMVVYTERTTHRDQETIRIISARKANKNEKALYFGKL